MHTGTAALYRLQLTKGHGHTRSLVDTIASDRSHPILLLGRKGRPGLVDHRIQTATLYFVAGSQAFPSSPAIDKHAHR